MPNINTSPQANSLNNELISAVIIQTAIDLSTQLDSRRNDTTALLRDLLDGKEDALKSFVKTKPGRPVDETTIPIIYQAKDQLEANIDIASALQQAYIEQRQGNNSEEVLDRYQSAKASLTSTLGEFRASEAERLITNAVSAQYFQKY